MTDNVFGSGPLLPLVRAGSDFKSVSGPDVVRCALNTILGTTNDGPNTVGQIPWDTKLGSQLTLLRFKKNPIVLFELGGQWVMDAINEFEPRVDVSHVDIFKDEQRRMLTITTYFVYTAGGGTLNRSQQTQNVTLEYNL